MRKTTKVPPRTAPMRPPSWGSSPDRSPRMKAKTIRTTAPASRRFTEQVWARRAFGQGRPERGPQKGRSGGSGYRQADRPGVAVGRPDQIASRLQAAQVDQRPLEQGDVDAGHASSVGRRAFEDGDRDR